jgi:hypothetical protein
VSDGDESEATKRDRDPADERPAAGSVYPRRAQSPPCPQQKEKRKDERADAHRPLDCGPDDVANGSRQPPPNGGGNDHGKADEAKAEPVAPVCGIEFTCSRSHASYQCANNAGEGLPQRAQASADAANQPDERRRLATLDCRRTRPP